MGIDGPATDMLQPFGKTQALRLLVIGGTGRLGRLIGPVLRAQPGLACVFQARAEHRGGDIIFDPLGDAAAYAHAAGAADVILNLAGPVSFVRGGDTQAQWDQHVALAQAAIAASNGCPVVQVSSAAVYGDPGPQSCAEAQPLAPLSPYGQAKQATESAVADHANVTVVRIGNVAGADALLAGSNAAATLRKLHVLPDGRGLQRSYIGPLALARALTRLVRLLAAGADVPKTINLALPGVVGMDDLLRAADMAFTPETAPAGTIAQVDLDVGRAIDLGLVPGAPARADDIIADLRAVIEMEPRP
ncbi:hypothetical protein BFP70_11645 [Thioclava sp. SK-1]|uniref:NAD-dependent epimerase/dehydratase family protein n=1 Tax=Thioclava sp. SK-1 TaxID=1889770 RepID=UPI000825FF59|nr:NAD-dependent epimerase/dehydratase family protein [Thioclava sp. SK-1]OCX64657.1 hypothetical protein BFP70_11645 [Thioclava sp. SK-1]